MADSYTFGEALREAQDALGGEHGVVGVDEEDGAISVHVSDQGAGRELMSEYEGH